MNKTGEHQAVYLEPPSFIFPGWGLGTSILVLCLGSLGTFLLVSYIVHWVQVTRLIIRNRRARVEEKIQRQHSRSAMVSIRALERQTTTFMDMGDDMKDEYGIKSDQAWVF